VHYYLSDHLNSTSMVISGAGAVEDESDYSPFGTEYVLASSGLNHYKFTSKERDSESGLDYFGARYYSNGLGRFITPDWAAKATAVPYAEFADPQTLNLYTYVRNIPTTKMDPDGHCGQQAGGQQSGPADCSQVKVTATPTTQPAPVQTTSLTDKNGKALTVTGPMADIQYTVTANGTPADGVKVTETNQTTTTKNGKIVATSKPIEGKTETDKAGKYLDTVGGAYPASKFTPKEVTKIVNGAAVTITDKQKVTLTFPNGCTCTVANTRTTTNTSDGKTISPSGYTVTTTQPVVTTPNAPQ
jgi:RHS repeat-associated protein